MENEIIQTKQDFKSAIKNKQDVIIVEGDLAKQLNKVSFIQKIDTKKLCAVLGISTTGIGVATVIGGPLGTTAAIATAAAKLSIGEIGLMALIGLMSSISLSIIISAFKDYDFKFETDVSIEKDGIPQFRVVFERKKDR